MKKIFLLFLIISFIALPFLSLAVDTGLNTTAGEAKLIETDIAVFAGNIIRAVLGLLGILILIFILYGGYLWLVSGGNDQMVKKAKDILTSAFIGLIIVLAAMAITTFIMRGITGAIGGSESTSSEADECTFNWVCELDDNSGANCNDGDPGCSCHCEQL